MHASPARRSQRGCLIAILVFCVAAAARFTAQGLPFDVFEKSIPELQAAMTRGEVTSRQLVDAYLARIAAYDQHGPAINALVTLNPEARNQADALDRERRTSGPRGPLHGIPIVIKDNYETIEMATGAGSVALAANHPKRDAFQVMKLRQAGVVFIGKTNMHELAAGITTISSFGGQTRNPYDLSRNPGGSSGGTGAAVAASFAAAGMGSDTCGSIRIPAANHALVGLRGTQGLSSRSGIVPLSHTQDIGGPIARTMVDLALMLDATVGPDPNDETSQASEGRVPKSYRDALSLGSLKGARLGIVRSLFGNALEDEEVSRLLQKTVDRMKELGAEPVDVLVPGIDDLLRDSSVIVHEFKHDLASYLKSVPSAALTDPERIVTEGLYNIALEETFNQRLAPSAKHDAEAYRRALVKQRALRGTLVAVLDEHRLGALVYPTLRRKPALIGDPQRGSTCQVSAHSGLPALSVPAGFTADGLPVGIEFLGAPFDEARLLGYGAVLEHALEIRQAPFSTPPLENGQAPAPRRAALTFRSPADSTSNDPEVEVMLSLAYDASVARLAWQAESRGPQRQDAVRALWLHRGTPEKPGPATQQVPLSPVGASSGSLTLSFVERRALETGELYLELYTRERPTGAGRSLVTFPQR
ncbi:MAG: amidase [Vicinamibacterales bacterium]